MSLRKRALGFLFLMYILTSAFVYFWRRGIASGKISAVDECTGEVSCPAGKEWPERRMEEEEEEKKQQSELMLVIFTTFKMNSPHHALAHRLVVSNWASFRPAVQPVLFARLGPKSANSSDVFEDFLIESAVEKGWDVLPLASTNSYGTPRLRPMYEEVFKRYEASFYGYANGDLMFTDNLTSALAFLRSSLSSRLSHNALLVGRRTDVQLQSSDVGHFSSEEGIRQDENNPKKKQDTRPGYPFNVTALRQVESKFAKSNLESLVKAGKPREGYAIDYFFFTGPDNSTFAWAEIADVVIGRAGVDNYLMATANRFDVNTVDISDASPAVHLAKPGVKNTGLLNNDTEYNIRLVGRDFPYELGHTTNARFSLARNDPAPYGLVLSRRSFG